MPFIHSIIKEFLTVLNQGGLILWAILIVGAWLYTILVSTLLAVSPLKKHIQTEVICASSQNARAIQSEYNTFILDKLAWLERRVPVILVMIGVCTLGGLLGTVAGMLTTFENMASVTQGDPMQKIATGISKALITTQVGLLFALPASFFFALLKSQIKSIHALLETHYHQDLSSHYHHSQQ